MMKVEEIEEGDIKDMTLPTSKLRLWNLMTNSTQRPTFIGCNP